MRVLVKQLEGHLDRGIQNRNRQILHDLPVGYDFFSLLDNSAFGMGREKYYGHVITGQDFALSLRAVDTRA